jgi:hypothetical protein
LISGEFSPTRGSPLHQHSPSRSLNERTSLGRMKQPAHRSGLILTHSRRSPLPDRLSATPPRKASSGKDRVTAGCVTLVRRDLLLPPEHGERLPQPGGVPAAQVPQTPSQRAPRHVAGSAGLVALLDLPTGDRPVGQVLAVVAAVGPPTRPACCATTRTTPVPVRQPHRPASTQPRGRPNQADPPNSHRGRDQQRCQRAASAAPQGRNSPVDAVR